MINKLHTIKITDKTFTLGLNAQSSFKEDRGYIMVYPLVYGHFLLLE
jgi:hypothetical protein